MGSRIVKPMNGLLRYVLILLTSAVLGSFVGGCQSSSGGADAEMTAKPTPQGTVPAPSTPSEAQTKDTVPDGTTSEKAVEEETGTKQPTGDEQASGGQEQDGAEQEEQQASVNPGINETFLDEDLKVSKWVERFEREGREVYAKRKQVLESVGVEPGDDVADIGAGTGFYTMLFAKAVQPGGNVYAVEIAEPFLKKIDKRARQVGLKNVKTVKGTVRSTKLPEDSIDLAFLCDVYHHFEYPRESLASIHTALRSGGEMIIIEMQRDPEESSDWVLDHVRAGKETFTDEIEAAGFQKTEEYDLFEENYMIRFEKQ